MQIKYLVMTSAVVSLLQVGVAPAMPNAPTSSARPGLTAVEAAQQAAAGVTGWLDKTWGEWVHHPPVQRGWDLRVTRSVTLSMTQSTLSVEQDDVWLHGDWVYQLPNVAGSVPRWSFIDLQHGLVCHAAVGGAVNCPRASEQIARSLQNVTVTADFALQRTLCNQGSCRYEPAGSIAFDEHKVGKRLRPSVPLLLQLYELQRSVALTHVRLGWRGPETGLTAMQPLPSSASVPPSSYSALFTIIEPAVAPQQDKLDYFKSTWRHVEHRFTSVVTLSPTGATRTMPVLQARQLMECSSHSGGCCMPPPPTCAPVTEPLSSK
jgi:hypothetical protein